MVKFNSLCLFLFVLGFVLLNLILAVTLKLFNIPPEIPIVYFITNLILGVSTVGVVFSTIKFKYKGSILETLGIRKGEIWNSWLLSMLTYLGYTGILILIHFVSPHKGIDMSNIYRHSDPSFYYTCVLAVFMAPIVEEIVFRGFLQNLISNKLGNTLGILITSLLFTLAHVQYYGDATALMSLGILALLLSILRYKTKSIMPTVGLHFLNNLICCLSLM